MISHIWSVHKKKCKRLYHLKCLALNEKNFEPFTEEYKGKWLCPECVRDIPKTDNSETPVRGHAIMNKTFTPNADYVNTERGGRTRAHDRYTNETDNGILDEIKEFRLEMQIKMMEQKLDYEKLKSKLDNTETELQLLRKFVEVLVERNEYLESCLAKKDDGLAARSERSISFASIIKQIKKKGVDITQTDSGGDTMTAKEFVATKPSVSENRGEVIGEAKSKPEKEANNIEPEGKQEWIEVTRKRVGGIRIIKYGKEVIGIL